MLPDEKKRGSVVVSNFSLFDNLIKVGSYGKITQIWRQDRFKLWKDENNRPLISEIVFNVAVPPLLQFEEVKDGPRWFFASLFVVRKSQYNLKAIDKLMQKGIL